MIATPEMLATLKPGELLVRISREGWRIAPDHAAIARANWEIRNPVPTASHRPGRVDAR